MKPFVSILYFRRNDAVRKLISLLNSGPWAEVEPIWLRYRLTVLFT